MFLGSVSYQTPYTHYRARILKGSLLTRGEKATDEIEFRERENSGFSLRRSSFIYRYFFFFTKNAIKIFLKRLDITISYHEKRNHNYARLTWLDCIARNSKRCIREHTEDLA